MVKIDQSSVFAKMALFRTQPRLSQDESVIREDHMTTQYSWQESYLTALLETDWTKMLERIQAVESEIRERQRLFSENHGGTAAERQAMPTPSAVCGEMCRELVQKYIAQKVKISGTLDQTAETIHVERIEVDE
jgi:hypothetical protein